MRAIHLFIDWVCEETSSLIFTKVILLFIDCEQFSYSMIDWMKREPFQFLFELSSFSLMRIWRDRFLLSYLAFNDWMYKEELSSYSLIKCMGNSNYISSLHVIQNGSYQNTTLRFTRTCYRIGVTTLNTMYKHEYILKNWKMCFHN